MTQATSGYDSTYWKRSTFRDYFSPKQAEKILKQRGYAAKSWHSRDEGQVILQRALDLSERGFRSYLNLTIGQLHELTHQRNIRLVVGRSGKSVTQKHKLIAALEDDDESTYLRHFLELPAELRLQIYNYYFADFDLQHGSLRMPEQPAVTVTCRQIRAEALPLFYSTHSFMFDFYQHRTKGAIAGLRLNSECNTWLRNLSPSSLTHVQRGEMGIGIKKHRGLPRHAALTGFLDPWYSTKHFNDRGEK